MAAVVGMRNWVSNRPLASGSAETVVVLPLLASYTICMLKLLPSSFLLGKPLPRTTAMVPTRPDSGVTVTSRLGMFTITTPVRPRESDTRRARSPSAVVASARGRSTEADQLPPLSTRTGSLSLIRLTVNRPTANAHLRSTEPGAVGLIGDHGTRAEPGTYQADPLIGQYGTRCNVNLGAQQVNVGGGPDLIVSRRCLSRLPAVPAHRP